MGRCFRAAFIGLALCTTFAPGSQAEDPVVVAQQIRAHRVRVLLIGLAIYDANPEQFPGITRIQVITLLSIHDLEKLNSPHFEFVCDAWGKPIADRPDWIEARDRMNAEGRRHADEAYQEMQIPVGSERATHLEEIATAADLVDRRSYLGAVLEMGGRRPFTEIPMSLRVRRLVVEYIPRWTAIVSGERGCVKGLSHSSPQYTLGFSAK